MAGLPPYTSYPKNNNHPSLDTYGSPGAPVIQTYEGTFYLPHDNSYPNDLHVITAFPGGTIETSDEFLNIDNDPIIQLDNYGSPLAPAIEDLSQLPFINNNPTNKYIDNGSAIFHDDMKQTVADFQAAEEFSIIMDKPNIVTAQVINLTSDVVSTNDNSVPKDQNIPQEPSSNFPDQNDPEKYVNNDQDTLTKVINTPVFYKDNQQFKENALFKFDYKSC